jgi:hypothetical protein
MLDDNRLTYDKPVSPKFFASCENLIAEEGSIFFFHLTNKANKTKRVTNNIIIIAKPVRFLVLKK